MNKITSLPKLISSTLFIGICVFAFSFKSNAQTLTSVSPDKGQLGQRLNVFIAGSNVDFINGSMSIQTTFKRNNISIDAPFQAVNQTGDEIEVFLDLSDTSYTSGLYDLEVNTPAHGLLILDDAFEIDSVALKAATPRFAYKGENFNVLLRGQSINFNNITTPPVYFRGTDTISTSIVQPRIWGFDTLEISIDLNDSSIKEGNYDLALTTSKGVLFLRNALEISSTNISGTVYYDVNSNDTLDPGEVGIGAVQLKLLPDSTLSSTNSMGWYRFSDLAVDTYQVVLLPPAGLSASFADTVSVNVSSIGSFDVNIAATASQLHNTSIYSSSGRARCNELVRYRIRVHNRGSISSSGTYYFVKDSLISYDSATVAMSDSVNGDTIFYSFDNLMPFWSRWTTVICSLPSVSVLPPGSLLESYSYVQLQDTTTNTPIAGAEREHTNSTIVRCSYDPNDKLVNPVGLDSLGFIEQGTPLEYTIRFQNTGNDTAYRVVIVDTLSSLLDYDSYEFLDASHDVFSELTQDGELTFTFNNIFLVDSTTNEPESNGHVSFRMNPIENIVDSTTVSNRASIFFDLNPPIVTAGVNSTYISIITSVQEIRKGIEASLYPNPSSGQINIQLARSLNNAVLNIYDINGKHVYQEKQINKQQLQLDLSNFTEGVYLIHIVEGSNSYSNKILLEHK